jgi:hypothetical protein
VAGVIGLSEAAAQAALKRCAAETAAAGRFNRSFTIEYPANGSFFRPQKHCPAGVRKRGGGHAVCKELTQKVSSFQLPASRQCVLEAGNWGLETSSVSFEF